ncbi:hypothetical protein DFH11DRAFT_66333 [Phellopilus nigrolimitatus]|nr:hypothetical protein DFH11DRAFT_66333 [Phellopilus nigrolimitatus]
MLKDFARRLFLWRSTSYFLFSLICACTQIVLRGALFVTDDDGARRSGAPIYPMATNASENLYSLLSNGGIQQCGTEGFSTCIRFTISELRTANNPLLFCPMIASYSTNLFRDNRMEDVVFVVIHAYLLFVTVYAIARESIPHIVVIFSIRFLSAIWSLSRFIETIAVKKSLGRLVHAASCPSDFFGPKFFENRHIFEGLLLCSSTFMIILEAFLATKLGRVYFKRPWRVVQVSNEMQKMYKLLLGFSVVVQISALIFPTTMALWIDQIMNTWYSHATGNHIVLFRSFSIVLTILLPPWIAIGWYSLRREWPRATIVFLAFGAAFLGCLLALPFSPMFRWTFTTWWFFGMIFTATVVLFVATLVLAVLCRRNFGKNLDHYLLVQSRLSDRDFAHDHFEEDAKPFDTEAVIVHDLVDKDHVYRISLDSLNSNFDEVTLNK